MSKLAIVKQDHMDDWYTIELAEHDHRGGEEALDANSSAFTWSGRISDADVEGHGCQLLEIAKAIEERSWVMFKRCAVDATKVPVEFWSPRNSRRMGEVSLADADDLAAQIRATLGNMGP